MRLLLSKKQRRQLQLLEILIKEKRWFHLKELAKQLDCTERSLKEDLSNLRSTFDEFLIESSTNGIKISYEDSVGLEVIYHHFFKESQAFALIEYLFFNKDVSNEYICRKFDLSYQSFYRLIRTINQKLQTKYNVKIDLKPLNLVGDEIDVRFFYAQYFAERYYYMEWPFPEFKENAVTDLITFFFKLYGYPLTFSVIKSYKVLLTVYLSRIKQGYFIDMPTNFDAYKEQYQGVTNVEEMLRYFSLQLGVELNERVLEQFFIIFIQENFYFSPESLIEAAETDPYAKESTALIKDMFKDLCYTYELEIENLDEMLMHVHNTSHLGRKELFSEFLLFDTKTNTNEDFMSIFPAFYDDLRDHLITYMKTMKQDLNEEIIKHMIYTVYTHWERLLPQLLRRRKSIKVLIISRFDDHHAKSMIDFLDFYCTDNFEFTQMIKYNLTVDDIEASDADVVVANFMMPELKRKPFICTSSLSSLELVEKLNAFFYDFTSAEH